MSDKLNPKPMQLTDVTAAYLGGLLIQMYKHEKTLQGRAVLSELIRQYCEALGIREASPGGIIKTLHQ